jgi:hypothetical protein
VWCCHALSVVASMINLGVVSLLQHPDQLEALKKVRPATGPDFKP